MTRFEREWNGELGEFWKKHAREEAQRLLDQADKLFPDSKLFQLIPLFQKADTSWKAKLQKSEVVFIRNEIAEWNLQANAVDQELLDLFDFPD